MTRRTLRKIGSVIGQIIVGFTGLSLVMLATPVSAFIGGALGILAGFGVILVGMLLVALIQ